MKGKTLAYWKNLNAYNIKRIILVEAVIMYNL